MHARARKGASIRSLWWTTPKDTVARTPAILRQMTNDAARDSLLGHANGREGNGFLRTCATFALGRWMAAAGRLQSETGIQAIAPIKPIHYRQVAASVSRTRTRSGPRRREAVRRHRCLVAIPLIAPRSGGAVDRNPGGSFNARDEGADGTFRVVGGSVRRAGERRTTASGLYAAC